SDCGQQNPHDEGYRRHVWPPREKSRGIVGIECATCYLERGGSSPLLHEIKRRRIAAVQSVNSLDARNFRQGYWLNRDRPCPPNDSAPRTTPGSSWHAPYRFPPLVGFRIRPSGRCSPCSRRRSLAHWDQRREGGLRTPPDGPLRSLGLQ